MAITKIEVPELFDFGSDNSAFKLPTGTTAERPTSPSNGEMRFNTTTGYVEYYDTTDTQWWEIDYTPDPFVPSENFNAVLYTGTGSGSKSVTGVGFQPDLVWGKSRNDTISHILFDVVRGENKQLSSNTTGAEVTRASAAYEFDSDGFTVTTAGNLNNAVNYVAWNWKAGGTAVSNTDGTITSQVSANVDAGFSIVSTQSDGSGYLNFGHGLSQAPELVITKFTSQTGQWYTYTSAISNGFDVALKLNSADAAITAYGANKWSSTDSVVGVGNPQWYFTANVPFITYCFHSVDGYSKIGSYVGTGATGNTIVTGFEPAWVIIKSTSSSGTAWNMWDNKRTPYDMLRANTSESEFSGPGRITFSTTGFQLLDNDASRNSSGGNYIFMAFAADPT